MFKKLFLASILMAGSLSADPYFTIGLGPQMMMPSINVGYRDLIAPDKEIQYDAAFEFATDGYEAHFTGRAAALFYPHEDVYVGPNLSISKIKIKHWKDDSQVALGIILGKDLGENFVDITIEKCCYSKNYDDDLISAKIRYGWYF